MLDPRYLFKPGTCFVILISSFLFEGKEVALLVTDGSWCADLPEVVQMSSTQALEPPAGLWIVWSVVHVPLDPCLA